MFAAAVVFAYLAVVLYVGIFAFRKSKTSKEDFFVANRSLGTFVFLLSLFGSNMTSFAILGSSGLAFRQGIMVYGLMASISGIVIPLTIFFIGTRIWAIGKRFGHITQVQIFRDRFEMGHIGTFVFILQAFMLIPYIIIGVMGGGETLEGVSNGVVPYWAGGLIVALVVMSYVFFGGMRGTAWVNTVQTLMFLVFGTIAFVVIAKGMGGMGDTVQKMLGTAVPTASAPASQPAAGMAAALLTRAKVSYWSYVSYLLIPLSSIMFPHIAIFCLTAEKLSSFKKTVILYPLCIMVVWLPAVFLGTLAGGRPDVIAGVSITAADMENWLESSGSAESQRAPGFKLPALLAGSKDPAAATLVADVKAGKYTKKALEETETHRELAKRLSELKDVPIKGELRRLANTNSDGVMLEMLTLFAPAILAGLLGAAIMACVMASDSQILALSTMFAEDIFAYYGAKARFGEAAQVWSARVFVVAMTIVAYVIALLAHQAEGIFEIAIQYAFSGYASMAPVMLACLFWKRGTKWGVLASTVWVAFCLIAFSILQAKFPGPAMPGGSSVIWAIGGVNVIIREYNRITFFDIGLLNVVPMFVGSALLMWLVSLLTRPPGQATIDRYFPASQPSAPSQA